MKINNDIDVTEQVDFSNNDDELLPISRCVCGKHFPLWTFNISVYRDDAYSCDNCGRKLYFSLAIRVFQVVV